MLYSANYPDILIGNLDINPSIYSPNADYCIQFALTKEQKYDYEEYEAVLKSAISGFRKSNTYRHYKSYLYSLGLDCCQFHPYIQATDDHDIATLEMHHCMLNIYDIAILIAEHTLNTYGSITEFDLDDLLRLEHSENNIPIVMLDETSHEKYHDDSESFLPPTMTFGRWWVLLYKYRYGISMDIAKKILRYISKYYNNADVLSIQLRSDILSFASYNEYGAGYNTSMAIPINEENIKEDELL
jgi:hypothetical protein